MNEIELTEADINRIWALAVALRGQHGSMREALTRATTEYLLTLGEASDREGCMLDPDRGTSLRRSHGGWRFAQKTNP